MKWALLVLADNRGISTFPAVYQTAVELNERGFKVSIITGSECDDEILEGLFDEYTVLKKTGPLNEILCFSKHILKKDYRVVICYEPRDARNSSIASFIKSGTEFVYYNLEVLNISFQKSFLNRVKMKLYKLLESWYTVNCRCIVMQDERRQALSRKHGIYHEETYLIPNSYYTQFGNTSDSINNDDISVLYTGSLEEWSISGIIEQLSRISGVSITVSGWSRDRYIERVKTQVKNTSHINLLEKKLDLKEYRQLVMNHHIGLVWYSGEVENVRVIGRSSGKFYMFLSCGKPAIVQNLPGIADDVRNYNLGIVIDDLNGLPRAVKEIKENYHYYCENVKQVYPEVFDYKVAAKTFFDYLHYL